MRLRSRHTGRTITIAGIRIIESKRRYFKSWTFDATNLSRNTPFQLSWFNFLIYRAISACTHLRQSHFEEAWTSLVVSYWHFQCCQNVPKSSWNNIFGPFYCQGFHCPYIITMSRLGQYQSIRKRWLNLYLAVPFCDRRCCLNRDLLTRQPRRAGERAVFMLHIKHRIDWNRGDPVCIFTSHIFSQKRLKPPCQCWLIEGPSLMSKQAPIMHNHPHDGRFLMTRNIS